MLQWKNYFFRFKIFAKLANAYIPLKKPNKMLDVTAKQEPNGMPSIDIKGILGSTQFNSFYVKKCFKKDSSMINFF